MSGCSRGRSGRATGCPSAATARARSRRSRSSSAAARRSARRSGRRSRQAVGPGRGPGRRPRRRAAETSAGDHHFPPPTLESVVVPRDPADGARLRVALAQLAEQDPLIGVRQDDARQEISVSLYGEVQKEVIQATLHGDYGLDVTFRETSPICIERPVGTGEAVEILHAASNPFLATIGLRIEPAAAGSGIGLRLAGRASTWSRSTSTGRSSRSPRPWTSTSATALATGPLRLAGHRLPRDDDQVHLQRP